MFFKTTYFTPPAMVSIGSFDKRGFCKPVSILNECKEKETMLFRTITHGENRENVLNQLSVQNYWSKFKSFPLILRIFFNSAQSSQKT